MIQSASHEISRLRKVLGLSRGTGVIFPAAPDAGKEVELSEGTLELLSKVDMGHAGRNFALPPEASKEHSRRAM
jgi:hypothetical protein